METLKKVIAAILSPIIGTIFYSIVVIINSIFEGESFDEIPSAFMFFIGNLGAFIFIAKFTLWLSPKSNWPYVFGVIVYTLITLYSMIMLGIYPFYYYLICLAIGVGATLYHQKNMSKEKISDEPDYDAIMSETKRERGYDYLRQSAKFLQGGDKQQAKLNAELALQMLPQYPDAYELLGGIHQELMEYDKAIEYFSQAINLSPEDCNLHFQRSNVYLAKNDYGNASRDLDIAIDLASIDSELTRMYDKRAKDLANYNTVKEYYVFQKLMQNMIKPE